MASAQTERGQLGETCPPVAMQADENGGGPKGNPVPVKARCESAREDGWETILRQAMPSIASGPRRYQTTKQGGESIGNRDELTNRNREFTNLPTNQAEIGYPATRTQFLANRIQKLSRK